MSGLNWGVGDLLTVTKLAWDLYHNCYLVAREAPEDFRQLVNELASLQGVLRTLRDDVNSDNSFLERLGDPRKEALEKCLTSCFATLHKLQQLVIKYRQLGVGDGKQFWRKLKWVSKKGEISDLKSRIMAHTCNLSLCMSSIGNSSLARIEASLLQALERQDASEGIETANLTTIARSQTEPVARTRSKDLVDSSEELEDEGLGLRGIRRAFTGATLVEPTADLMSDMTPPMSEGEISDSGSPKATSSKPKPTKTGKLRKASTFDVGRTAKAFPPSPLASEECPDDSPKNPLSKRKTSFSGNKPSVRAEKTKMHQDQGEVMEVVADAMHELSKVRQKEQSARPLRVVREDPVHQADDALRERFQQLAEDELRIRRLSAKDWLRVATWWLLKSRNNAPQLESQGPKPSLAISSDDDCPTDQAYVDLLKASWIMHTIVLNDNNMSSLMTDENRKLFYNLSDGINEDLSKFQAPDACGRQTIMNQNINIWELLQPEEETFDEDDILPEGDNQRWITVEQDDAGEEDETVLYRTFVNAAIGSKRCRIKSRGAPYMLIISTKDGESQPKITICNQSGTISLTRDIIPNDLQDKPTLGSPSLGQVDVRDGMPLNFGQMNITVAFTTEADQQRFMDFPRNYFTAVRRREPRHLEKATETLLFDRSVEVFEQLKPTTLQPMNPCQQWRSCDVRLLETTNRQGWRTTRRLVISSSACEKRPWCTEIFLPLSNVRIRREGMARAAVIKWSDCAHEQSDRTDGNYNRMYSYVYDQNNPNIALGLLFRNSADASDFENTILKLSLRPIFSSATGPDTRHVYDILDTEPISKNYKAILLTHTRLEWRYSELFYIYRDIDYHYDHNTTRVRFPHLYYTKYISSHVEKLYKPDPGAPPQFSHCEKRLGNTSISFSDEQTTFHFLSALSPTHTLIFSRRALSLATKPPRIKFGSTKSTKGPAQVQLWRRKADGAIRLVARWDDGVEDQWLSLPITKDTLSQQQQQSNDSNRASLPKGVYERGRRLDLKSLAATDSRESKKGLARRREGPVMICFESVQGKEEFAAAVEGSEGEEKRERERKGRVFDEVVGFG
ncbi:MAG: hypothetical protein Q9182_004184 [Xanthomendoza sp. 2 TL-2023]